MYIQVINEKWAFGSGNGMVVSGKKPLIFLNHQSQYLPGSMIPYYINKAKELIFPL